MPKTDIINEALLLIRAVPMQGSDADLDSDPRMIEMNAVLASIEDATNWEFMNRFASLNRDAEHTATFWTYAYILPADRRGWPRAYYSDTNNPPTQLFDYELNKDRILTDAEAVWCRYSAEVDPKQWPGTAREFLVTALASRYAISVRADRPLSAELWQRAYGTPGQGGQGGLYQIAAARDAASRPPRAMAMPGNFLSRARYNR